MKKYIFCILVFDGLLIGILYLLYGNQIGNLDFNSKQLFLQRMNEQIVNLSFI